MPDMLKEYKESANDISMEEKGSSVCAACCQRIEDRFYLMAVDRQWHLTCLQCHQCKLPLHTQLTCYSRHGNIYCKEDYYRLFAVKRCVRCQAGITARELVMRARDDVYHVHCFTCGSCGVRLAKGDHFGIRDGIIYCRPHYETLRHRDYFGLVELAPLSPFWSGGFGCGAKGRPRKRKADYAQDTPTDLSLLKMPGSNSTGLLGMSNGSGLCVEMLQSSELSSSMESLAYDSTSSNASPTNILRGHSGPPMRTKRMRTSFKHHQLRTMKSYFNVNQNPDAKDLKQLAQKTGLSKRVLQVWFQNARAKWRRNIMRQETLPANGLSLLPPRPPHDVPTEPLNMNMVPSDSSLMDMDEYHNRSQNRSSLGLHFEDHY